MKKLLFLFVLFPFLCFGQNDKVKECLAAIENQWEVQDGEVIVQKVLEFENISKDNIYIALKEYLTKNYGSQKEVIQIDDRENGIVIIKGIFKQEGGNIWIGQKSEQSIWHILKFEIKDNRMRATASMDKIDVWKSSTQFSKGGNSEIYLTKHYPIKDDPKIGSRIKSNEGELFCYTVGRAIVTIADIDDFIQKASAKQGSDEW